MKPSRIWILENYPPRFLKYVPMSMSMLKAVSSALCTSLHCNIWHILITSSSVCLLHENVSSSSLIYHCFPSTFLVLASSKCSVNSLIHSFIHYSRAYRSALPGTGDIMMDPTSSQSCPSTSHSSQPRGWVWRKAIRQLFKQLPKGWGKLRYTL